MKRAVIRLPGDLVDRLDRLARELRREHPASSYSRASVARALIANALVMMSSSAVHPSSAERSRHEADEK